MLKCPLPDQLNLHVQAGWTIIRSQLRSPFINDKVHSSITEVCERNTEI